MLGNCFFLPLRDKRVNRVYFQHEKKHEMNILLSETNDGWACKLRTFIEEHGDTLDIVINGRDAQALIHKNKYDIVILDFNTSNYSALEVLRFIRVHSPHLKVVLTFPSKAFFDDLGLEDSELKRMGATDILLKPIDMRVLKKCLAGDVLFDGWKKAIAAPARHEEETEVFASDNEFTRIKADGALAINRAIFDLYVRIGKDKYLKILHEGDTLAQERLSEYQAKKVTYFYFKTRDRGTYINFINTLLSKIINKSTVSPSTKMNLAQSMVDKFIEEIYTVGIKPALIEEGKQLSENIYQFVQSDRDLNFLLQNYVADEADTKYLHLFLVSFFSTIICKATDWAKRRTVDNVVMGALLHDIGKIKIPQELRLMDPNLMSPVQVEIYKTHPTLGVELLKKIPFITEPVLQIVEQHHETIDGSGFPSGLTSTKIYPLAKIVGLADHFTNLMLRQKLSPKDTLRRFLGDRKNIQRFEADLVLKLAQGFLDQDQFLIKNG